MNPVGLPVGASRLTPSLMLTTLDVWLPAGRRQGLSFSLPAPQFAGNPSGSQLSLYLQLKLSSWPSVSRPNRPVGYETSSVKWVWACKYLFGFQGITSDHFLLRKTSKNQRLVKHIDVKDLFVREVVGRCDITLRQVDSETNVADVFTKPLGR
ncbi:hypothetical protein BDP27DRAFT_1521693, partial [Rhodocollybia butyracea]